MIKEPLVSIIIPTYNRAHLIEKTLDSIIVQTYTNWECIVVDDGSTDDTDKILMGYCKKDERIQYHHRPNDRVKGANACRNYGFELSKGEYVNWFDSDDLMVNKKLEVQVDRLLNTECQFTVCQTIVFKDSINNKLGLRNKKVHSADFFNDFITNEIKFLTQSPMFKKEFILSRSLKYDESLSRSQERDFFVKVLALVNNYDFIDEVLVFFRLNENSISHGKITEDKVYSSFKVDFNIVKVHHKLLKQKTILLLKKKLINEYYNALSLKYYNIGKKILYKLLSKHNVIKFSAIDKIMFISAFFFFRIFKKGYFLLPKNIK
ncbi:glycosyltransferase family 2 protein [Wenyingzhuangia marina]|uniref:Glycosyltransferase involved in cell wall bisynthesis n=1 Tax=Wenyingzhuangia marina TaxID=1195760 RepID=A0A1M5UAA1_9FLAO|nr:glycosyltransferase family 2 protein [Wenyingzhuangia marina]GGF68787.1 hypothetical protein GCM10011397_09710 [Wenyingzhuangia marina]SHH59776.1 Glycosyltransferase involved in cell wall bisynthesis [Wenyingzhuangia marina]